MSGVVPSFWGLALLSAGWPFLLWIWPLLFRCWAFPSQGWPFPLGFFFLGGWPFLLGVGPSFWGLGLHSFGPFLSRFGFSLCGFALPCQRVGPLLGVAPSLLLGGPMELEWNIIPGFTTLQLCYKVQEFLSKMSKRPEECTGRNIFMSMFNDISWGSKDNEQECELSVKLVSTYARRFSPGRWSLLGSGSEKKWYSTHKSKPQGECDRVAVNMVLKFSESGQPSLPFHESIVPRNAQKQRWWKIINTLLR